MKYNGTFKSDFYNILHCYRSRSDLEETLCSDYNDLIFHILVYFFCLPRSVSDAFWHNMGSLQWSRGSGLLASFAQGLAQGSFGAGITKANGNDTGTVLLSPQIPRCGAIPPSQPCSLTRAPFRFNWNGLSKERFRLWISLQFSKRSLQTGERKQERRENRRSAERPRHNF